MSVHDGLRVRLKQSQWHKFLPGLTTSRTLTNHRSRSCKFIGHLGDGTRKMPKGGIHHIYIRVRASCHPIGQCKGTHGRRCHARQENAKNSNTLGFWSGCRGASQTEPHCSSVMLHLDVCSTFPMIIIRPDAESLSATARSFKNWPEFI